MPQSSAASAQAQTRTEAAYSRWAPIYDLIFDLPFHPGRLAASRAAAAAAGAGGAMLVVGVGTGLELELLPADLRVTGVDISAAMLDVARERVARKGLRQVKSLQVMDAGAMDFADGHFDVAMAPYVMSVVPNPARVLSEVWRVIRPGGRMVVMNHFAAAGGPRAAVEAAMEKAAWWLGWHPKFPYAAIGDWIAAQPDAELIERRKLPPLRLFTLLVIGKRASAP
jgi:phosphatidylethanolamine/phosphatidyl-N-methylethanolamine N-methyltransferase